MVDHAARKIWVTVGDLYFWVTLGDQMCCNVCGKNRPRMMGFAHAGSVDMATGLGYGWGVGGNVNGPGSNAHPYIYPEES